MISRNGEWVSARSDEEMMLLNIEVGRYLGFNSVGARIWELIETPITEARLCERLVSEFEVSDEECRSAVRAFLKRAEAAGAIAFLED